MRCIRVSLVILFVVSVRLLLAGQQAQYTVTDLGTLGGNSSVASGINEAGQVNGISTLPDGTTHAFRWTNGVMTDLETLGGPNSFTLLPLNDWGTVVGFAETSANDPLTEDWCGTGNGLICLGFLWNNGVMTPLPTLGGNNGRAHSINNWGQAVGLAETSTSDSTCAPPQVLGMQAVIWQNGTIRELPPLAGDPAGDALGINDKGEVVGYSTNCAETGPWHAVLWREGKPIDLGNLGGQMGNIADAINYWDQVVGSSDLRHDKTYHTFLWQKGVMSDLGTLPGDVNSSADGINNLGQVVGGSYNKKGGSRAYIWQHGVMTDLNTLIPQNSSLYLLEATGSINDRGQIAGFGVDLNSGDVHAFLATPNYAARTAAPAIGKTTTRPQVTVPDYVRKLIQQKRPLTRFQGGSVQAQ